MLCVLKHDLIRRSRLIEAVDLVASELKIATNSSSVASKKSVLWPGGYLPNPTIYVNSGDILKCLYVFYYTFIALSPL